MDVIAGHDAPQASPALIILPRPEPGIIYPDTAAAIDLIEAARRDLPRRDRPESYASGKRPLLRGCLVGWLNWAPIKGHPLVQHGWCTIAVWCPYCGDSHYHGWSPTHDGRWAEHRVAHCFDIGRGGRRLPRSPFRDGGYYIAPWRKTDPGFAGHEHKPGVPILRLLPVYQQRERLAKLAKAAAR